MSAKPMTLREAAERTSRSITTLRRYIRAGRLRAEKRHGRFGPEYYVSAAELIQAGLISNPVLDAQFNMLEDDNDNSIDSWEFHIAQDFMDILMMPMRRRVAKEEREQAKLKEKLGVDFDWRRSRWGEVELDHVVG